MAIDLFGYRVYVYFLVSNGSVLAYGWHYTKDKAYKHLQKIMSFHGLGGSVEQNPLLEEWLMNELKRVVINGERFNLPNVRYLYREVYEELIKLDRGVRITYSELARRSGYKYIEVLKALMRNPFQILIPCHRLITKSGGLMGFYPLGIEVKKRILEIEGIKIS